MSRIILLTDKSNHPAPPQADLRHSGVNSGQRGEEQRRKTTTKAQKNKENTKNRILTGIERD